MIYRSARIKCHLPTRARRGAQAIVEFALVVPILFMLIFGVLDAGRAVVAAIALSNAATISVRYAAVNCGGSLSACTTSLHSPALPMTISTCLADPHPVLVVVCSTINAAALGTDTSQIEVTALTVDSTDGTTSISLALVYPFTAAVPLIGAALGTVSLRASASTLVA